MVVPNYIPEQLEVPGNVAEQHQRVRVFFIRQVSLRFFLSAILLVGLLQFRWPKVAPLWVFAGWLVVVVIADILRILHRGESKEAKFATALLPILVLGLSWCLSLRADWIPVVTAPVAGIACWLIYAWLCGRDFSFVGCFLLSLIFSSVSLAMAALSQFIPSDRFGAALAANALVLFYGLYDLASIQSRRRIGEEWAAVADIFRDFLNIFGYIPRVIRHWKKYPVWNITR